MSTIAAYLLGILSAPLILIVVALILRRVTEAPPVDVRSNAALQDQLRSLLTAKKSNETIFVVWPECRFVVRVLSRVRKTQPTTLVVQIRNSRDNGACYDAVRSSLVEAEIEFDEKFTPAKHLPSRLRLIWPVGGPATVSAAAHVISVVERCLPDGSNSARVASRHDPNFWLRRRVAAV